VNELPTTFEQIAVVQVVAAAAAASVVWMETECESESAVVAGVAESVSFESCSSFLSSEQSPDR